MSARTTWRYDRDEASSPHGVVAAKPEDAVGIAVRTAREAAATPSSLTDVIFACLDEGTYESYIRAGIPG